MRLMPLGSAVLVLVMSGPSFAQEWTEFASREEHFTITFPGQPKVTETTWTSQFGTILPARIPPPGMVGIAEDQVVRLAADPFGGEPLPLGRGERPGMLATPGERGGQREDQREKPHRR